MEYIKSPLNYVGGKYKLLKEIIPLFPDNINTFIDMFGGGFNVGVNVNANKIIYNDIDINVVDLLQKFYKIDGVTIDKQINNLIIKYGLSRKKGFSEEIIKQNYLLFFTLISCSFSNQIRFNSKGQYNMPYGKRYYNQKMQKNLLKFISQMHMKKIQFLNCHFNDIEITKDCFVYADPPYYNSVATYNEQGGWTEENEQNLLNLLDDLNEHDIKFALSNNLKYENPLLDGWKDKYKVHYLNGDYSNCNYHKIDRTKDIEVLITNY